jgi:hypothetical protein
MEDDLSRGEASSQPLELAMARLLSSGYGLSLNDVLSDAREVLTWKGSADDLMSWIEARHHFTAGTAARYLRDLHVGLRSGPEQS